MMVEQTDAEVVPAAGAVVWRRGAKGLEVALVHRVRYNDWSWPKGKLDPGESFAEAAVREVEEETGLVIRLGIPLPELACALRGGATKIVRYWAGHVIGGSGALEHEVDEVRWLSAPDAREKLSYERDRIPLDALLEADAAGELDTWPLLLVRHTHAQARSAFRGDDDRKRPRSPRGHERAERLRDLLGAWAPERVVSSPSTRCVQTVAPFVEHTETRLRTKKALSEEGFSAAPHKVERQLDKALERALPVVLCTHRPLVPMLVGRLSSRASKGSAARRVLGGIKGHGMDKGEILVCQMVGQGDDARVVSVERLRTPTLQR